MEEKPIEQIQETENRDQVEENPVMDLEENINTNQMNQEEEKQ